MNLFYIHILLITLILFLFFQCSAQSSDPQVLRDLNLPLTPTTEELSLLSDYTRVGASDVTKDDAHSHDLPFTPYYEKLISYLTDTYWDMPTECRKDICPADSNVDMYKGEFNWPQTSVGERRLLRCPYAVHDFIYAHRDCLPVNETLTEWGPPDISLCPPPPFNLVLDQLSKDYKAYQGLKAEAQDLGKFCFNMTRSFLILSSLRLLYPDHPILNTDYIKLTQLYVYWIQQCLSSNALDEMSALVMRAVHMFSDLLESRGTWYNISPSSALFSYYPDLVETLFSVPWRYRYEGSRVSILSGVTRLSPGRNLTLYTRASPSLSDQASRDANNMVIIQASSEETIQAELEAALFTDVSSSLGYVVTLQALVDSDSRRKRDVKIKGYYNDHIAFNSTSNDKRDFGVSIHNDGSENSKNVGLKSEKIDQTSERNYANNKVSFMDKNLESKGEITEISLADLKLDSKFDTEVVNKTVLHYKPRSKITKRSLLRKKRESYYQPLDISGPMIYLRFKNSDNNTDVKSTNISITFKNTKFLSLQNDVRCARIIVSDSNGLSNVSLDTWSTDGCSVLNMSTEIAYVTCQCEISLNDDSANFISVFSNKIYLMYKDGGRDRNPVYNPDVSSFSVFLGFAIYGMPGGTEMKFPRLIIDEGATSFSMFMGFPYNKEVFIVSQILRPLSMICLLVTVISHLLFRKTRKGVTARILINLCASLIALQLTLYLAELVASNRVGCRASNILRYYTIMASLMWNGAEAHNMYRMLVKVFSGENNWFVLKAGLVAWGLPVLVIGISLIVRHNVFDGTYFNCKFRCSLDHAMLIYAYLIPMLIIVLHNIIMFSLVLRVLHKNVLGHSKAVKRSNSIRLTGAVTMLVLLGVPWVFSAFGVIDSQENTELKNVEAAFNIIFIVFINLQGVFIFCFHCARNHALRKEVTSLISKSSIMTSSSYGKSNSNTRQTNSSVHQEKQDIKQESIKPSAESKDSTSKV